MRLKLALCAMAAALLWWPAAALATCSADVPSYSGGTDNAAINSNLKDICSAVASSPVVRTVTSTDRGGTVTTGGTAQTAIASNTARKGGWIMNPNNATETLYVSTSGAAACSAGTPNDADLSPGQSFGLNVGGSTITSAVSICASTTGHTFEAKELQ